MHKQGFNSYSGTNDLKGKTLSQTTHVSGCFAYYLFDILENSGFILIMSHYRQYRHNSMCYSVTNLVLFRLHTHILTETRDLGALLHYLPDRITQARSSRGCSCIPLWWPFLWSHCFRRLLRAPPLYSQILNMICPLIFQALVNPLPTPSSRRSFRKFKCFCLYFSNF